MYNKLNLAVGKVASKTSIKPELGSIAFYGNKTVATDSFRLLEVSAPGAALEEPVMLNANHLKGNFKMTPDKERMKFDKEYKAAMKQNGFLVELDEIKKKSGAEPIEGTFPKYEDILEPAFKREDDIKFSINGKYLAEMLTIMAGTNKFAQVEFSIPQGQGKAIVLTAKTAKTKDSESQIVRGLIMPMNK